MNTRHNHARLAPIIAILVVVATQTESCTSTNPPLPTRAANPTQWNDALKNLASQLTHNLKTNDVLKIALLDFSTTNGGSCDLGGAIAEDLTTYLFKADNVQIIERRQLARVLEEQKMSMTDLLDPRSAARIGQLLGATAVLTGSMAASSTSYHINARVILVESATVVSVAQTDIARGPDVDWRGACGNQALSTVVSGQDQLSANSGAGGSELEAKSAVGDLAQRTIFYYEDFSKTNLGDLPAGWKGPLGAVRRGEKTTLACLKRDATGPVEFRADVLFPDNWIFSLTIRLPLWRQVRLSFGGLSAALCQFASQPQVRASIGVETACFGNNGEPVFVPPSDRPVTVAVEKRGRVARLLVDGKQVAIDRTGDDYFRHVANGAPLSLEILIGTHGQYADFQMPLCESEISTELYRVEGRRL